MDITMSTLRGWTKIMNKVDMQSVCKNGRYFDLIDVDAFNLALTKYIGSPHEDIEDSNFFMIYLKPGNLYPKEDQQISCMRFEEFKFSPQIPVAESQGTFCL